MILTENTKFFRLNQQKEYENTFMKRAYISCIHIVCFRGQKCSLYSPKEDTGLDGRVEKIVQNWNLLLLIHSTNIVTLSLIHRFAKKPQAGAVVHWSSYIALPFGGTIQQVIIHRFHHSIHNSWGGYVS